MLCFGSSARAIDPSEVILTLDTAFARPLGPTRYADGYYSFGMQGMVEKIFGPKFSAGVAFSQYTISNTNGDNLGLTALDLMGRRWWHPWHAFNPYILLGLGGNLFRASFKQPFGDYFHAHIAFGSQYVFDTHWALDYAVDWNVMAPLDNPHHFAGVRLGLSYRYGTQPHVNRIAPAPVEANAVEELSVARVEKVVGKQVYKVKVGDTLYGIAAKQNLLGHASLWPLVAEENADTIKDPSLIYPDQLLQIHRHYTDEQAEKAREIATKTDYKRPTPAP